MSALDLVRAAWRKSSYSNGSGGTCVELAVRPGGTGVRDSKNPAGGTLIFARSAWNAFSSTLKSSDPRS